MTEELRCGVYEHYKGSRYFVVGIARDDATEDLLVIYTRLYRRDGVPMSARRLADFLGVTKNDEGAEVQRFRYIGLQDENAS